MSGKRGLTDGEKALVREAFEDRLPYEKIRLIEGASGNPAAMAAFKNGNTAITLRRSVYFRPDRYRADLSAGDPRDKELLLHEMTHIWQYKRLTVPGFLARYAKDLVGAGFKPAAMYRYEPGKTPFKGARLEAQAQMVGDYCEALVTGDTARRDQIALNLKESGLYRL